MTTQVTPAPNDMGHVWDHDEGCSYCTVCGGRYRVWDQGWIYNGEVHGYSSDQITRPCPGVKIAHGAAFGEPGYNPDCDCMECG